VEAKPKISAPQAQGARRDGGHTIPPRLAAETNKQGSGDENTDSVSNPIRNTVPGELLEDADYQRSREEAEAHERARDAVAAERLREYIKFRGDKLTLGDAPPQMPGTEWRNASGGGWNLWETWNEGEVEKSRYKGHLAPETWEQIRAGAGVRGVDRGDGERGDSGDGDVDAVSSGAEAQATMPHVADATEPENATNATRGIPQEEREKWGPNVVELPASATRGMPHVAQSATNYTQKDLPRVKWFTFERRKVSRNTWAYCVRWHELDDATGLYKRVAPIYVRRVDDPTDAVLRRRDNEALKKLVRQWYEQKIEERFVSAN
jgi:DNA polymerase III delta prime subunit